MRIIEPEPLSVRLQFLRDHVLNSSEKKILPWLLFKPLKAGKLHLLGRAWKYYYSHVKLEFSAMDILPSVHTAELPVGWEDFNRELLDAGNPMDEYEVCRQKRLQNESVHWDDLEGLLIQAGHHFTPGYEQIIREGYPARLQRIRNRLSGEKDPEKADFLNYLLLRCEGVLILFRRMGKLLLQAEKLPENADRSAEIHALADAYFNLCKAPAGSFWEALLTHLTVFSESPDSPGCPDRYFEPFVRRDLQNGTITENLAFEYLCAGYLRYFECTGAGKPWWSGECHASLAGTMSDGSSAVGICTELCMKAQASLQLMRPQITLRWTRNAPDDFLLRGIELLRWSRGTVDFSNDEVFLPVLQRKGIAPEDACTYSPSGCNEVAVPGKSHMGALEGHFNLPLLLNILFGQIPVQGLTVPDLDTLTTFEDFRRAYRSLQQSLFAFLRRDTAWLDKFRAEANVALHFSLYMEDCISRAIPVQSGGAHYNASNQDAAGLINLAESMLAVKRLVYDEKRLTLRELAAILAKNWQGYEALRLEIRERFPHFGNDLPEVDSMAGILLQEASEDFDSEPPVRGGHYNLGTLGGYENAHIYLAQATHATPDGRTDGEPFSSGLSAVAGRDKNGPTAYLNSVRSLGFREAGICTSTIVNLMLSATLLETESGRKIAAQLLETYFQQGGIQLQITVADTAVLEDALVHPEKYPNLVVRVSGYSALFSSLPQEVRAEVVQRTVSL